MERTESPSGPGLEVGSNWRTLVERWTVRGRFRAAVEAGSVSVEFDIPETGREVTVRFMTTREFLVAFMTDGRHLRPDQLALAAAAANAWNTEQLIPMLSVWDVRGPTPCIAGVCSLPLTCRMTQADFDDLARNWTDRARQMFTRCHQVFRL